jgi:SAM-dependent methyltransferase
MNVEALYEVRFAGELEKRKKNAVWKTLCEYFFQTYIPLDSCILDIAAGYCEFLNNIKAKQKIAFDLNPLTRKYANPDISVHVKSFFDITPKSLIVDVIFASNVFEHLNSKADIITAFELFRQLLRPSGKILILQPNIRYTKEAYWDFIDHKIPLTDRSLIEAAEMSGFKLVKNIPRFLPYTTRSQLPQYPFLVYTYLKLMPVSGWLFGQQSFLVFENVRNN